MILEFTVLVPKKKNSALSVDEVAALSELIGKAVDQKPKTIEDYEKKKAWIWIDPESPPVFGAYYDDSGVGTFFDLSPTSSGCTGIHLEVDPLTALSAIGRAIYDAKSGAHNPFLPFVIC